MKHHARDTYVMITAFEVDQLQRTKKSVLYFVLHLVRDVFEKH